MASQTHEILILGGNLAGVSVAHHLFRTTIPQLSALDPSRTYHITIVSPSPKWFFKLAAPRAVVNATLIPVESTMKSVAEAFSYAKDQFTFVEGTAISISPSARTVEVKLASGSKELRYDSLILATGTTSKSPLWTLHGDPAATIAAFSAMHKALPSAKTVLIAGAGAVGVETAGEIKAAYPSVAVTLLTSDVRVLPRTLPATSSRAESYLKGMGIDIIRNVRTESTTPSATKGTTVKLSDGTEKIVDVYIDATGGRPNTEYVPAAWLNEQKRVVTKDKAMRVKGEGAEGVYVIGDIGAYSNCTFMDANFSIAPLISSIAVDIAASFPNADNKKKACVQDNKGIKGKVLGKVIPKGQWPVQVEFSPMKNTQIVPIGRNGGVAEAMGWKVPSMAVYLIKGRTFFMEKVDKLWGMGNW